MYMTRSNDAHQLVRWAVYLRNDVTEAYEFVKMVRYPGTVTRSEIASKQSLQHPGTIRVELAR